MVRWDLTEIAHIYQGIVDILNSIFLDTVDDHVFIKNISKFHKISPSLTNN